MLTKPDIADEIIISHLETEYNLNVTTLTFLPLGNDLGAAVYRVVSDDGTAHFLKLRKGFIEITVTVPLFLKSQGIQEIIAPFETRSKRGWADLGEYKMILYPFIEGKDGFEAGFSDQHWQTLGKALKKIHSVQVQAELKRLIPQDTCSPQWRKSVRSFQKLIERKTYHEPTAAKLADFMKSKKDEIARIIDCAEGLAAQLQTKPMEQVLCHADTHGGNILISNRDELFIVDWDYPMLSLKEHDLMFVGGGFIGAGMNDIARRDQEETLFYDGYGKTEINLAAMAYYRYDRIINDISAYCEQLLLTDAGGADRESAFKSVTDNFEPNGMIASADETYKRL